MNRIDFQISDKAVEKLLSRKVYLLLAGLKWVYNFPYHGGHCLYGLGTHVHFFQSSIKIPEESEKLNIKVKDGAIILDAILGTLAGILSRLVLFVTFEFLSVSTTFSTGIWENWKARKLFWMLLRYALTLLEDPFVDPAAKVGPMFTKKSLNDSEISLSS